MDKVQERIRIGQAINLASEYVLVKDKEFDNLPEYFDRVDLHARKFYKQLKALQGKMFEEIIGETLEAKDLKVDQKSKKLTLDF